MKKVADSYRINLTVIVTFPSKMTIKFYYCDARGLGEPIRWILPPPEIKKKSKWGQVPLVELEDGRMLNQSITIMRYFATKANLVPADPYKAALCDEYVDAIKGFTSSLYGIASLPEGKEKDQNVMESMETSKTNYWDVFYAIIKSNGGNYLTGDKLTWSDIVLAYALHQMQILLKIDLPQGCGNMTKLKEDAENLPGIKAWLEKRPVTRI